MDLVKPGNFYFKFFRSATSSNLATATPGKFRVVCPAGRKLAVVRINFSMVDGAMGYGKFGGVTALSNGLLIQAIGADNETVLVDFTDGEPIHTNEDFSLLAGVDAFAHPTAGDDFMPIRWTLHSGVIGACLLTEGQSIQIHVRDALNSLTTFQAMLQGRLI